MRNDDSNVSKVTDQYSSAGVKVAQLHTRLLRGDLMMCPPTFPITSSPQDWRVFNSQKSNFI